VAAYAVRRLLEETILWVPVSIFQLVLGLWLLMEGVAAADATDTMLSSKKTK
jgi:hypothetical protein